MPEIWTVIPNVNQHSIIVYFARLHPCILNVDPGQQSFGDMCCWPSFDRNVGYQRKEGVQLHGHELNTTSDWLLISLLVFVNCLEYWQQTDTRLDILQPDKYRATLEHNHSQSHRVFGARSDLAPRPYDRISCTVKQKSWTANESSTPSTRPTLLSNGELRAHPALFPPQAHEYAS